MTTPGLTINKVCGSGLKAVHLAVQAIRSGDAEAVIAGGRESMSRSPYLMTGARAGLRLGHAQMVDSVIHDGLWDAFNDYHMGITAENPGGEIRHQQRRTRPVRAALAAEGRRRSRPGVSRRRSRR